MSTKRDLDQDLVRQLAKALFENDLAEIEIEQDGVRLRVIRARPAAEGVTTVEVALPATVRAEAVAPVVEVGPHPGMLSSPMVGTAFRAEAPTADPFVQIGDTVREGQTVLIIEAMKVMNHIPAPRAGKVVRILVEDGQPVEYGEPLMIIEELK